MLKPDGPIYMKTEPYRDGTIFDEWYYTNDPTHVFFYHEDALDWMLGNT